MTFDLDRILAMVSAAEAAFDLANRIADQAAEQLADAGQAELKERLARLRAQNDADRARRHAKLVAAAGA